MRSRLDDIGVLEVALKLHMYCGGSSDELTAVQAEECAGWLLERLKNWRASKNAFERRVFELIEAAVLEWMNR